MYANSIAVPLNNNYLRCLYAVAGLRAEEDAKMHQILVLWWRGSDGSMGHRFTTR